jgi:hypothetical protein
MTKLIQRALVAAFVFFAFGASIASAQSINLSNDPVYATQFSHYCPPYEEPFVSDGIYTPTDRSCIYSIPTDVRALGYNNVMALYQGVPGNSTLVRSEFVFDGSFFPTLVQVQDAGNFSAYQTGDKFFGVVFSAGPLISSQFPDLIQFNDYFTVGSTTGTTSPNNTFHILPWELAAPDIAGPEITISSPTEGTSYAQTDTVPFTVTINDASPIKFTQYYFNNSPVSTSTPLPLGSAPLGAATVTVVSSDIFNNLSNMVVNFIITDTPPPADTAPPVIIITNPIKYGVYERAETVFLTATVTDASALAATTYWFNGKLINPANKLTFNSSTPFINKVMVAATDIHGNAATSTLVFFVVRSKSSCLIDIIAILIALKYDNTLPDKPTLQQLKADCKALLQGHHHHHDDDDDDD